MNWPFFSNPDTVDEVTIEEGRSDVLRASITGEEITAKTAMKIPAINASIGFIANQISVIPIKLYRKYEKDGVEVEEEVKNDYRLKFLNKDTENILTASDMWKIVVEDYYMAAYGARILIDKKDGKVKSLNYIEPQYISAYNSVDPIDKDYTLHIGFGTYNPFDFISCLRKTRDGLNNITLFEENKLLMEVMNETLKFERDLVTKGGNKKGFIKSVRKLSDNAITALKTAWRKFYDRSSENVIVLNEGLEFQEVTNTSVEMQINENKKINTQDMYSIIGIPEDIINGTASNKVYLGTINKTIVPILNSISDSINQNLLREDEKEEYYFQHDLTEVLKGDIKERYEAYKEGIDGKFLQIDEVRKKEKLPAIGLEGIIIGLDSAIYNPRTKEIYTLNTDKSHNLGKGGEDNENNNS